MAAVSARRKTTLQQRAQGYHTNCPKHRVHGAPPPKCTVHVDQYGFIHFVCPRCAAHFQLATTEAEAR